jgi:WD40 repeat protein
VANPNIAQVADAPGHRSCYTEEGDLCTFVLSGLGHPLPPLDIILRFFAQSGQEWPRINLAEETRGGSMSTCHRLLVATAVILLLVAGCGKVEPTATPVPPKAVPPTALPPTAVPPTAAPPTVVPRTAVPPTVAPALAAADSQVINLETAAQLGQAAVFDQPASFVHTVTFSPDSRYLITADQNGDVIIREAETWKEHKRFATQADISSASLSPDGTMIVTGGAAGNVMAWDLAGNELFSIPYSSAVFCTQFSPDGRYLAVGGENDQVMIVDVATQQKVTDLVSDHQYVSNLVFSPDNKMLLVGYERPENVIKIWDTSTWEESATFSHVTERMDYHDLVFSPDGRYLVVASTQNAIKFLDVATWQVVKELEGHTRGTYQVAFSADGALLVSACDDGSLRLWDVETGDSIKTIRGYRENVAIDLSPDGTWIAFSG